MKVFLTGATGFIGSAIIPELIHAGHQVLGLTRSDEGAETLKAAGIEVHRGNIDDLESLRRGAEISDGVIHCAFNHDFANYMKSCEQERLAIEAIGSGLAGTGRPLVITSATPMGNAVPGEPASEDFFSPDSPSPRKVSEVAGLSVAERGVNVSFVRLPQVHNTLKFGLITYYIQLAREKGVAAYVGDGMNRWPAVHRSDAARVYKLAIEKQVAGRRYNAVAEEGVPMLDLAEVIGQGLKLPVVSLPPEKAENHFGWLAMFVASDMPASSALTQQWLDWHPTGPGIISDLEQIKY